MRLIQWSSVVYQAPGHQRQAGPYGKRRMDGLLAMGANF